MKWLDDIRARKTDKEIRKSMTNDLLDELDALTSERSELIDKIMKDESKGDEVSGRLEFLTREIDMYNAIIVDTNRHILDTRPKKRGA